MYLQLDFMGLIASCVSELGRQEKTADLAYALGEFANNLQLLVNNPALLDEWKAVYVGQDGAPLDIDKLLDAAKRRRKA